MPMANLKLEWKIWKWSYALTLLQVEGQNYNPPISTIVAQKFFSPMYGGTTDEQVVADQTAKLEKVSKKDRQVDCCHGLETLRMRTSLNALGMQSRYFQKTLPPSLSGSVTVLLSNVLPLLSCI